MGGGGDASNDLLLSSLSPPPPPSHFPRPAVPTISCRGLPFNPPPYPFILTPPPPNPIAHNPTTNQIEFVVPRDSESGHVNHQRESFRFNFNGVR